jgi:Planctomycete cytochrome C
MRRRLLYCALVMVSTLGSVGCDEALSDLTGPTPNLEPTFSSIQQEIFSSGDSSGRPACTSCHNPVLNRGGLDLSPAVSYNNLVNFASRERPGVARVLPNNPDDSYLIHKIEGRAGIVGGRMPLGGPFLAEGQILVIRRWIEIGAPNN